MELTPKQKQQKLFDDANLKLQNSFYRHNNDPKVNASNLEKFSNGLHTPLLKLKTQQTILYTVREVKNKDNTYSYEVYLPGEAYSLAVYKDIKEAYEKCNSLNQTPVVVFS